MATYFSNNPLKFDISSTADNLERIEVYLETQIDSGVYTKLATWEKPTDASGDVSFDLQQLIHEAIAVDIDSEAFSDTAKSAKHLKGIRKFYYRSTPLTAGAPGSWTTSATHLVIYGGLNHRKYKAGDFFTQNIGTDNQWLTWQPDGMRVSQATPVYMSAFIDDDMSLAVLRVTATFSDGTTDSKFVSTTAYFSVDRIYTVPLGYDQLTVGDIDPLKTVVKYTVTLEDDAEASNLRLARTFILDTVPPSWERYFIFINSLGGMESFRMTGERQTNHSTDRFPLIRSISPSDPLTTRNQMQYITEQAESFVITSGVMDYDHAQHFARELLASPAVWEWVTDERIPVSILTDGLDVFMNERFLHEFRITYQYSIPFGGFETI